MDLFTVYILPFLVFGIFVAAVALRVHWFGGPGMMALVFFALAFGPSLLYALITDASSLALFMGSLVVALVVVGFMFFRYQKRKR